jgi:hypothetical protein
MTLNYAAIFLATVVQFIIGAIWYTPIFGKLWGKIHGFDKLSKDVQMKMMKSMGPVLAVQFLVTILTSFVLELFVTSLPAGWNVFGEAGFFWLGFVVPTQVSAVLFGGTEGKWVVTKILISAGGSLACLMSAAAVLGYMH